jgi:competence protein ComEC
VVFLTKSSKNETNANKEPLLAEVRPSDTPFEPKNDQYIKDKHKESLSRVMVAIDSASFLSKRLINSIIDLSYQEFISVKYRYLLGQKSLEHWRQHSLEELEGLVGARGLPLVKGMLFGDLSGIDQEMYHSFKVIGILHILSASSANFTIFLHFCLFFLKPVLRYLTRTQHFWLYFLVIFIYFSLVGPAASTIRAFLTLSLAFLATFILKRAFLPVFNLYLAGILMLIINPFFVGTLGFQFSFLASFGILFLYNFFEKEPSIKKNYFLKSILLTFCAQFFLMPIFIFNFAELNYLAILANFLILPLVEILTVLFLASYIILFLSNIFPLAFFEQLLSFSILKTLDILFFLINFLEKIPWKNLIFNENKDSFTIVFLLINILSIIWVFYLKNKRYSKNKYRVFK